MYDVVHIADCVESRMRLFTQSGAGVHEWHLRVGNRHIDQVRRDIYGK